MKNKEKNFISAVVYVHNEEEKIKKFLKLIINVLEENFEHSEIICVNDCSDDSSAQRIKEVSSSAKTASVSLLNMSYYHGLEVAMNAGVDLSIGDFVFEFDSIILDFDSAEIMKIYKKSLEGFDIVSASPNSKQKISSRCFYYIFNKFTSLSYDMCTERFRILSRRVINRISNMNKSVPYRKVIYANCGLKTENMSYPTVESPKESRHIGKKERKYRRHLAVDTLILFTELGYHFSIVMTALMMLLTVFMLIYSMVIYLASDPVVGWTTTILFLSVAFFGLFGILTIIIKYLQILIDMTIKRKRYSFESIEKLTN